MDRNILKRVATVICAIAMFLACGDFLHYILIDDTRSYTRLMFHELYNSPQNIDIAFVGSSHVYRGLNPVIADKGFGKYTFNAGSSGQALDGSLAIIQELCAYHKPEQIFLELYYVITEYEENVERKQMVATYVLSDYMKPSLRKWNYMLRASSDAHYVNSFILARRNWKKLFDIDYISRMIRKKQSDDYKNFCWPKEENEKNYYVERGFVAYDDKAKPKQWYQKAYGKIKKAVSLTEQNDWYKALNKIIAFCKSKKIKLTFIVVPEPEWTVVGQRNYQEYHDFIKSIADKNEIDFFDFNLCKPAYFDARDLNLFIDEDHLNSVGAAKFSALLPSLVNGKISEDKLFYKSFNEKLMEEEPTVYGLAGLNADAETGIRKGYAIANRNEGIEYRIQVIPNKGKTRLLQNYSVSSNFELPKNEHGKVAISWRLKSNPEIVHNITAKY